MRNGRSKWMPLEERFWRVVEPEPNSGCWLWIGCENGVGYGVIRHQTRRMYAHRYSYELHGGSLLSGMELDHLCRVRSCVNPKHLEQVTKKENLRRSPVSRAGHGVVAPRGEDGRFVCESHS